MNASSLQNVHLPSFLLGQASFFLKELFSLYPQKGFFPKRGDDFPEGLSFFDLC